MVEMIITQPHVKAPNQRNGPNQMLENPWLDWRLVRAQRDFTGSGSTSFHWYVNSRRWNTRAKPQAPI